MVAYSFQKRFVAPIIAGTKAQTIRGERKRHARQDEQLQLYIGMRTRHCKLIGKPTCMGVIDIALRFRPGEVRAYPRGTLGVTASDLTWMIAGADLDHFARCDGFDCWTELQAFWDAQHAAAAHPDEWFFGVLITWDPAYFTGIGAR